jgi:hypothetical protein
MTRGLELRALELRAWTRGLRARFSRGARAPFGSAMTLLLRRASSVTILQPVSVHLRWTWASAGRREDRRGMASPLQRVLLQRAAHGSLTPGAARSAEPEALLAPPLRRESTQDYFTTRLHTASRSHTVLRTTERNVVARNSLHLNSVSHSMRRLLVVEPVRQIAPRLREVYARQEEARSQSTPVLRGPSPGESSRSRAAGQERETRVVEMAPAIPAAPAPPPNVEWITSQVIQQIDRRLVAYRERMGKV